MTKINITRKHLVAAVIAGVLLFLFTGTILTTVIVPKTNILKENKNEIKKIEKEVAQLKLEQKKLSNGVPLMESDEIVKQPKIPSEIEIKKYLTNLEENIGVNKIQINGISASESEAYVSKTDPNIKLFVTNFTLSYTGGKLENLLTFIHALENGERFITPTEFSYAYKIDGDDEAMKYDNNLSFNLYYLQLDDKEDVK